MRLVRLCAAVLVCAGQLIWVQAASAQAYPTKPVRIIVGFAPGGGTDVAARMLAQRMSQQVGQPVVVENRPGASGAIANAMVATAPPDGYMLVMTSASAAILPALNSKLSYNLERDLAHISLFMIVPTALVVHPSLPVRNTKELIALVRSQPGRLNFGSSGIGSHAHLAGELFNLLAKIQTVHVPYKGSGESVIANASGDIEMGYPSIPPVTPLLKSGKLRALAVTLPKRISAMPELPTLSESGVPGYDYANWVGVSTTAGVPREIITRLNTLVVDTIKAPDLNATLVKQGLEPRSTTPEEFSDYIRREVVQNAKLVKLSGAKAD